MTFRSNFAVETQKNLEGVSVHSGFPNPADGAPLNNPDFNRLLIQHPSATFCMRIAGHEWERQGIYDGDITVIDRALSPKLMDLVIYVLDDGFAISRFSRLIKNEIWGVVTSVIHQQRV
jgi:DNA polymerase V